jgi:hypothetical protein
MDYLNVGCNGFAQVGDPHYYAKNRVEMSYLLELIVNKFPIPEQLKTLCRFAVKTFPHDFGTYHEIVLHFDDLAIGDGSEEDEEDAFPGISPETIQNCSDNDLPIPQSPMTLHDIFWDWFREVESFDMETEEITEIIKSKYFDNFPAAKSTHLIIKKRAS